jgi:murein DD-endopeptidase MepM/ murein hydrolase activator NlpD
MTGLATGPHLHYEYLMNGVHKDPQTVQLPGAEPLRAESLSRFRTVTAALVAGLAPATAANQAASLASSSQSFSSSTGPRSGKSVN